MPGPMGGTVGYAGDLTPREAFDLVQRDPDAVLVDVRTEAEWRFVGVPSGLDRDPVLVSWLPVDPTGSSRSWRPRASPRARTARSSSSAGRGSGPSRRPTRRRRRASRPATTCSRVSRARSTPRATVAPPAGGLRDCPGGSRERTGLAAGHGRGPRRAGPLVVRGDGRGVYLTSGYVYENAAAAEAAFAGDVDRYVYSRYGNPTVSVFTERLRQLEGPRPATAWPAGCPRCSTRSPRCWARGTGSSRPAASSGPASSSWTRSCPAGAWRPCSSTGRTSRSGKRALAPGAQAVFFETPANPMQTLVDVAAVAELAHAAGATVVVDNAFASPVGQRPLRFGADVVVYSATKHIDGQGRVMGGAVLGSRSSSAAGSGNSPGTPAPRSAPSTPGPWPRVWRP